MKRLLPPDFYSWSVFSDARQIDFNGHLWVRHVGNVVIDRVAISEADRRSERKLRRDQLSRRRRPPQHKRILPPRHRGRGTVRAAAIRRPKPRSSSGSD
jgi:hypothetical protein